MMNLIIIEDEPPILRAIKSTVLSYPEHFNILDIFNNGETALYYLNHHSEIVDVILTDIQVPVITGLELIKIVHEKWPHISNIIITGYNDFSYARKSISLQVVNYLLKPIDEVELHKELIQIFIKKCKLAISTLSLGLNNYFQSTIEKSSSYYSLAVIGIGNVPFSDSYSDNPEKLFNIPIKNTNTTQSEEINKIWCFNLPVPTEKLMVISSDSTDSNSKERIVHNILKPYMDCGESYTIIYSLNPSGLTTMNTYISLIVTLLHQSVIIGKSQLINIANHTNNMQLNNFEALHAETTNLKKLFINIEIKLFQAELKQLIIKMEKSNYSLADTYRYFLDLIRLCLSEINLSEYTEDIETLLNKVISASSSYIELYKNILNLFYIYFNYLISKNSSVIDKQQLLLKIDQYLTQHFTEDINTQQLAEEFNFTPSYLSKLFTDYKTISPTKYIISLRIQKAKDLLSSNRDLNIKEIANFVGYEDPLYFSKVFKKETGLSPKQFIHNCEQ
ncbi:MAG: helix-turn-helix domain-containing protein [Anaerocolumna sp.]